MNKYIGKRLDGRYEIKELIGIGGMADVYKAYDITDEKDVAVKILKDEYLANEDFKRRFRNESKAIAMLSHPNIVKIFDVSFGDRIQFIVMEHINGITLKEYIEQQNIVQWKEAVHFTVQILRALQHAHDNGIVHRDIKPQNVMLLQDGTVKVMDFGIARFARDNGRTISEKAIGSVHYISPEQAKGDVTDEKTDIYSVGVLMFEMLTGKLPFDGDSPVSVAIKQMQTEPEKPREVNPEIPEGLEEIIVRAMKKDPDLRYQTAAEMLRDIDEFKRNPSIVFEYKYFTDDGSTKYFDTVQEENLEGQSKKKKWSPTMQILVGVAGACVLLAIIAIVIFFIGIKETREEFPMYELIGLKYEDVIKDSEYSKVKVVKSEEKMSDEYEEGIIIDQNPKAKSSVKVDSTVRVIVSSGLNKKTIPTVKNLTQSEAEKKLKEAGFDVTMATKFDNSVDEGKVISTSPEEGEKVKVGSKVTIFISGGTANMPVTVPDLRDKTEAGAKQALLKLKLRPGTITLVDSDKPKGTVVGQNPAKGSKVAEGTLVNMEISNGNAPKQSVTVSVPLNGRFQDKNYTFDYYLDGEKIGTREVNPATTSSLEYSVTGSGTGTVIIRVNEQKFAEFKVDFTAPSVSKVGEPDYSLIEKKEDPVSSKPESKPESKPDVPTSSQGQSSTQTGNTPKPDNIWA